MKKSLLAFILWVAFAVPGFCQSEEEQTEKDSLTTMEEVVVTATKTEEKRKDVPNSLVVMDEMDIEESSAKSLGELLANELGIDWRTQGNYGGAAEAIHIRGMSGNATQIFVNGVSINSPSLGLADVGRIPLNNIERIEVVKGSGSLLYGSGAMGGTVNIITKRPKRDRMDLKVSGGYGTEDTYQVSAEQGMFVLGDFGYYLTANRRETDGFRDNSDLEHQDVSLKLVFEKGNALDISLYGDYIERDYGIPGVKPPAGTKEFFVGGTKVYNDEVDSLLNKGSDEDYHAVLEVKSQATDWLGLRLMGNYTNTENYNYFRYVDFFGNLLGNKSWTTNEVYGVEGNINIKPFKGANLLLGSEYKYFDWENKGVNLDGSGNELDATRTATEAALHTTGIFSEAQYRPCRFIKGIAGIRHEDHSQFGKENLPRFGLILNPLQNTALKATHGRHFLAPTPNDLFWPNDGFTKGDP
ncbi:MAG: TonB-dependent receptor, partial [Desulfobacterales bacterium]|nr:TonB-dependent receptor [Desulfobacterales bacterium]